ncbi:hypothetical protein [Lysinibacillus sp. LZ02]|uniref:hypothetical protein n=1 Tax=Lysinibacillus sp. LZ02 TaxID=3420668 RepID=UPI003D35AD65
MKKISSIILASLVLVGCNQAIVSNVPHAEGKVILEDNEYRMELGEYEWDEEKVEAKRVDEVSVEEIAEKFDTLDVMKDSTVKIDVGENPSTISVNQWNVDKSVENVEVTNSEITLPSTAGYYIYEIIAEWDQGRITYVFDVNVL